MKLRKNALVNVELCCKCGCIKGYVDSVGYDDRERLYYSISCLDCDGRLGYIFDDEISEKNTLIETEKDVII